MKTSIKLTLGAGAAATALALSALIAGTVPADRPLESGERQAVKTTVRDGSALPVQTIPGERVATTSCDGGVGSKFLSESSCNRVAQRHGAPVERGDLDAADGDMEALRAADARESVRARNPFSISAAPDPDTSTALAPRSDVLERRPPVRDDAQARLNANLAAAIVDDDSEESPGLADAEFTFSPLPGTRHVPMPAELNVSDTAYAHLSTIRACSLCIVKWHHAGSDGLEILTTADIRADNLHTIYITPESGWTVGRYVLSIYDARDTLELLGRAFLDVINVRPERPPVQIEDEFIHNLLSRGRAVSKLPQLLAEASRQSTAVPDHALIQRLRDSGQAFDKVGNSH